MAAIAMARGMFTGKDAQILSLERELNFGSISDVLLSDTTRTASLQIAESAMNEAFPRMKMALDTKQHPMDWVSRRTLLQKRQDVLPANVSDSQPLPPVNNTTNATTSTADLNHSLINHQFLSHGLITNEVPFTLTCQNCSMFGTATVTRTEFNFANLTTLARELTDDQSGNFQLFESGSLELEMNGFGAHVELESSLVQQFTGSFTLVPDLPIFGYEVPDLGILGLYTNVTLNWLAKVQGGLTFGYGFDVVVPDGSKVLIDFANISDSTEQGFTGTTFTALPFTANITEIDITASVTLHPQIIVGFEFGDKALGPKLGAKMEAGVFLNMPKLQAVVALAAEGVDATCAPAKGLTAQDQGFLDELGNLTHITPSAELDLGVQANLGITAGSHSRALAFPMILAGATTTLPTACLAFDKVAHTFGDAQSMFAVITNAAASSASASASASRASAGSGSGSGAAASSTGKGAAGMVSPPTMGMLTARDAILMLGMVASLMIAGGAFTVL